MATKAKKAALTGQTIVVTGTIPGYSRDAFSRAVAAHGGFVAQAVNGSTTILIVGEEPGEAKIEAAQAKIDKGQDMEIMFVLDFQHRYPAVFADGAGGKADHVAAATGVPASGTTQARTPGGAGGSKASAGSGKAEKQKTPAPAKARSASAAGGGGSSSGSQLLYLECHEGTSNKFYRMELDGTTVTSTWGATDDGKPTSSLCKLFSSEEEAIKFFDKTEKQKRAKGYE